MDSISVALFALVAVFSCIIALVAWRSVQKRDRRPCYRCGAISDPDCDYMGLHYCHVCRDVVVAMINVVQHDPPYGFPGNKGYLEFPEKELK